MAAGSPIYRTRPTAIGQHSTGALTPTTKLAVSALTSSPSRTAKTPGASFAAGYSIEMMSAWACGERRITARSVPGRTPRSSSLFQTDRLSTYSLSVTGCCLRTNGRFAPMNGPSFAVSFLTSADIRTLSAFT
jgi:hypothetical protein